MVGKLRPTSARLLLSLVVVIASATAGAETATFTLDEVVRPPFNPICPERITFRDDDAAVTLNGGGVLTGNPSLSPSTVYVAASTGCPGYIQMSFNYPATNPTFTLGTASYWRDRYLITASIGFTGTTVNQTVELRGNAQSVTIPSQNVVGISIVPLNQLGLIGYFHYVDDISYDYQPSNTWDRLDFAITPNTPADQRRVLIHKYRTDGSYPSPFQQDDRKIRISGVAMRTVSGAVPGATVYFRVIDPADTAPYVPAADRVPGDNKGNPGTLSPSTAVADSSGRVNTTLTITDRHAGDNYVIEASPDAQFSCSPNCSRSGTLTAWKRVYVEQNRMLRRGTRLLRDITPGDTEILVADRNAFPAPPFQVKLVHAPPISASGPDFYEEVVEVTGMQVAQDPGGPRPGLLLTAGPIQGYYMSADQAQGQQRAYLSDGVGLWTGGTNDHFSANLTSVAGTFSDAFVEYVFLPEPFAGTDGSVARIDFGGPANALMERDLFAFKWGRTNLRPGGMVFSQSNHQILYIANTSDTQRQLRGVARVLDGSNDCWLFMSRLTVAQSREAAVHELTHQWRVNNDAPWHVAGSGGHCNLATAPSVDRFIYNNPSVHCTMNSIDTVSTDGIIGFHYVTIAGQPDSEYLWIRQRQEPVPQIEVVTLFPRHLP